jgi:4-hydroxy-3-polyprenylbenzoate decarboxylase
MCTLQSVNPTRSKAERRTRIPFDGLRAFLSCLEEKGQLSRVTREINGDSYDISIILDELSKRGGKAVLFENIRKYSIPMCANILGTLKRLSMALETTEQELSCEWEKRMMSSWPAPVDVSDGPCKEVIIRSKQVDLYKYPILKWNPLDAGPYITLGVLISKDLETGIRNAGIYRMMVQGKNQLGINMLGPKHITAHYEKAQAKGKPLQAAVVIGLDPTIVLAAATRIRLGEDELAFAGALRKEPVKVASCETVDIEVPASAEIVIEGRVPPGTRAMEGPFGESTGYYNRGGYMPVMRIEAITQRENPIYQATHTGKPPKEEHVITGISAGEDYRSVGSVFRALSRRAMGEVPLGIWGRLRLIRLRLMGKSIRFPQKDIERVMRNWNEYGLE